MYYDIITYILALQPDVRLPGGWPPGRLPRPLVATCWTEGRSTICSQNPNSVDVKTSKQRRVSGAKTPAKRRTTALKLRWTPRPVSVAADRNETPAADCTPSWPGRTAGVESRATLQRANTVSAGILILVGSSYQRGPRPQPALSPRQAHVEDRQLLVDLLKRPGLVVWLHKNVGQYRAGVVRDFARDWWVSGVLAHTVFAIDELICELRV